MELTVVEHDGHTAVEGVPGEAFLSGSGDALRLVEECAAGRTNNVVLYAHNLPLAFYDLSSGEAGEILQKLRNYGLRLAVVCAPGDVAFSTRFGDMVVEERGRNHFGLFETREEAWAWLTRNA